jgi:hypothetical protein
MLMEMKTVNGVGLEASQTTPKKLSMIRDVPLHIFPITPPLISIMKTLSLLGIVVKNKYFNPRLYNLN